MNNSASQPFATDVNIFENKLLSNHEKFEFTPDVIVSENIILSEHEKIDFRTLDLANVKKLRITPDLIVKTCAPPALRRYTLTHRYPHSTENSQQYSDKFAILAKPIINQWKKVSKFTNHDNTTSIANSSNIHSNNWEPSASIESNSFITEESNESPVALNIEEPKLEPVSERLNLSASHSVTAASKRFKKVNVNLVNRKKKSKITNPTIVANKDVQMPASVEAKPSKENENVKNQSLEISAQYPRSINLDIEMPEREKANKGKLLQPKNTFKETLLAHSAATISVLTAFLDSIAETNIPNLMTPSSSEINDGKREAITAEIPSKKQKLGTCDLYQLSEVVETRLPYAVNQHNNKEKSATEMVKYFNEPMVKVNSLETIKIEESAVYKTSLMQEDITAELSSSKLVEPMQYREKTFIESMNAKISQEDVIQRGTSLIEISETVSGKELERQEVIPQPVAPFAKSATITRNISDLKSCLTPDKAIPSTQQNNSSFLKYLHPKKRWIIAHNNSNFNDTLSNLKVNTEIKCNRKEQEMNIQHNYPTKRKTAEVKDSVAHNEPKFELTLDPLVSHTESSNLSKRYPLNVHRVEHKSIIQFSESFERKKTYSDFEDKSSVVGNFFDICINSAKSKKLSEDKVTIQDTIAAVHATGNCKQLYIASRQKSKADWSTTSTKTKFSTKEQNQVPIYESDLTGLSLDSKKVTERSIDNVELCLKDTSTATKKRPSRKQKFKEIVEPEMKPEKKPKLSIQIVDGSEKATTSVVEKKECGPKPKRKTESSLDSVINPTLDNTIMNATEPPAAKKKKVGRKAIHASEPFNPRLLLIKNRAQLDTDEVLTVENNNSSQSGNVQCGLCLEHLKRDRWALHLSTHYGIGWIVNEMTPLEITLRNNVLNAMVNFIKSTGEIFELVCRMCQRSFRSALGTLGHIERCGAEVARFAGAPLAQKKVGRNAIEPFNPRLLLIKNRAQLDTDEVLTVESNNSPQSGNVQCGLCLEHLERDKWVLHLSTHYGIGWIVNEMTPVELTLRNNVLNAMVNFIKATEGNFALVCQMCQRSFRSALGALGHIERCGAEVERIACQFCNHQYSKLGLAQHERLCAKRRNEKQYFG